MAIQWQWDGQIGELDIEQNEKKFTMTVYTGNALMIFLHETEKTYSMYTFFADKAHFKNCANDPDYNYASEWRELRLWKKPTADQWHVIEDLAKRGVNVRFIQTPKQKKTKRRWIKRNENY